MNDRRKDSLLLSQQMHYIKNEKGEVIAFPSNLNQAQAAKGPDSDENLQNAQKFKVIDSDFVIDSALIFQQEDRQTSTVGAAIAARAQGNAQEAHIASNPADDDSSDVVSHSSSIFESTRIEEADKEGNGADAGRARPEKKVESRPMATTE